MKPLLLIAIRNVTLNWRHSLASLLSITAAFFSLNIFQGYIHDLGNLYFVGYRNRSMYGDLMIENRLSDSIEARAEPEKFRLDPAMQDAVMAYAKRHPERVDVAVRFLNFQGTISNGSISTIFLGRAYDAKEGAHVRGDLWRWDALYGEPLYLHSEGGGILLGQQLGRMLGCAPNPVVSSLASTGGYAAINRPFHCQAPSVQLTSTTDSGQVNAIDLDTLGLVDAGYVDIDRKFITVNLADGQTLLNTKTISYVTFLLREPGELEAVKAEFESEVVARHPSLRILRWQDHALVGDLYNRSMELLGIFRNFVVIVIISISALSVMNTMTKSLSERTREVGTLMSLGFRRKHIRFIFLAESLFLCLIGIAIGGASSFATALIINKVGILYKAGILSEPVPFRIALDVNVAALSIVGLVVLSAIATLAALQRVLKMRIVECLHHV